MSLFFLTTRGVAPFFSRLGAAPRARLRRLFFVAAMVACGFWMWQWLSTDEKGEPLSQKPDEPALEIDNLQSLLVRRDGKPLWEINARRVTVSADNSSTLATGVERGTLFREGKPFLKLSAPHVRLSNPGNDLEASGGVAAIGPDGFSFQTSRALWRSQAQIVDCPKTVTAWLRGLWFQSPLLSYNWQKGVLTCPAPVEVRGDGMVMRGKNLEATLKTEQVKMSGGVQVIIESRAVQREVPGLIPAPLNPSQNN